MRAADGQNADGAEEGGGHLVRDGLREGAEDEVDDAPDRLEIGADRRRIGGGEHAVVRHREAERPERAAVDRHVREDVLQRDVAGRIGGVARDVERPAGAGRRCR